MLSDGYDDRLMVRRRVDRRKLVEPGLETTGDIGSQLTTLSSSIQALEESKFLGVGGRCLIEGTQLLNDDVRVTFDLAIRVELLRSCKVVGLRIDEETCLHVLDRHRDGESLPGLDCSKVRREGEL